MWYCI